MRSDELSPNYAFCALLLSVIDPYDAGAVDLANLDLTRGNNPKFDFPNERAQLQDAARRTAAQSPVFRLNLTDQTWIDFIDSMLPSHPME